MGREGRGVSRSIARTLFPEWELKLMETYGIQITILKPLDMGEADRIRNQTARKQSKQEALRT